MKNKIFTTLLLTIIMIFSMQLSVQAAIVSTDKEVESGSGTVTISITSKEVLGAYTLKLTDTAGLTLVSAAGGEVSADKKTITGSAAEGTTSLGTYTFNVPTVDKETKYNIKFSITGMETPTLEIVPNETNIAVLTVYAKPVTPEPKPNPTPEPTPTPEPEPEKPTEQTPNFTNANKTMYAKNSINLRKSWTTSSEATGIEKGTELKITGTSNNKVNGYVWYRVSYNGKTLYVASNLLTDTKPEEEPAKEEPTQDEPTEQEPEANTKTSETGEDTETKVGLKTLEIEGLELSPKFSPDVYEYRVIVKEEVSELAINAIPTLEESTTTIAGNILQEGENLITIVVYNAKNEVEATYQITVNKSTIDLSQTDKMLKEGTEQAKRNMLLFIAGLAVALVALIVVMIIKRRNEENEYDYEEDYEKNDSDMEQFTNNEEIVENTEGQIAQDEANKDEIRILRREKRKGKHF